MVEFSLNLLQKQARCPMKMNRATETLVTILCLSGTIFLLDRPIQRKISVALYAEIFASQNMIPATNQPLAGHLRSTSSSPSKFLHPETPVQEAPPINDLTSHQRVSEKPENHETDPNTSDFTEMVKKGDSNNVLFWNADTYEAVRTQEASFERTDKIILVGDEKGYINGNGELVVDVNETYLFWNDGQEKLCDLLQNMTLAHSIDAISAETTPSTVLKATMDCVDHNENKQGLGQGNWITAIFAARMAAYLAGVDFQFRCLDGEASKMSLLLPWFDKYQKADRTNRTVWPHGGYRPTAKEACPRKYPFLRIDKMAFEIQDDLRKMAVSLVGSRDKVRRHPDVPTDATPLIPNIVLDDVAIHFRCGDVLGGAKRNDFGMIRFNEYKKWIPDTTQSIGILTQPFERERNRGLDSKKASACRTVVHALVDYLQGFAPNATIRIHNGVNETHPLAFARLVMANHSITSLSSFGIFPTIGTFGQGYFQKGNRGVNPFATYVPDILPNIHQMEAEVRGTGEMFGKSVENLLEWFLNDTGIV